MDIRHGGCVNSNRRYGIFGGTFDPPHIGHLILAMEAADQLNLEKVLWVLTPDPPHKQGKEITAIDTRIKMVMRAIGEDALFEMSYVDIDRAGPHYILDTMQILQERYAEIDLVYLMGGDSLQHLLEWYKPKAFIEACDYVGVMRRPGETINLEHLKKQLPELLPKLEFIDAPLLEISSNQIRQMVAHNQPFRYYLTTSVYEMVKKLALYKEGENNA